MSSASALYPSKQACGELKGIVEGNAQERGK
jgi:hypothetical protein